MADFLDNIVVTFNDAVGQIRQYREEVNNVLYRVIKHPIKAMGKCSRYYEDYELW